jgi:hypothetical protein
MRRLSPPARFFRKSPRFLVGLLALAGQGWLGGAAHGNPAPEQAETPEQAERRMILIEAAAPPPESSPFDAMEAGWHSLIRVQDESIGVAAAVLDADGRPINRSAPGDDASNRLLTHIQPSDTSFSFRHWEKGHAPFFQKIAVPGSLILKAATAVEKDARVVELPPVTLERGVPGFFRLLTPDGRPVTNAVVQLMARPREGDGADLEWNSALGFASFVESDADGRVSVENISGNFAVQATVWADGFLPARRVFENLADGETPDWSLAPVSLVKGLVIDARTRAAIPGARLEFSHIATPEGDGLFSWESLANSRKTTTDENGLFLLPRLPAGWRGSATLKREGFADLSLGDLTQADDLPQDAVREHAMKRGHRLAGQLRVPPGFLRDTKLFFIEAFPDSDPAPGAYPQSIARVAFQKRRQQIDGFVQTGVNHFDSETTELPFVFPNLPEGRVVLKAFFSEHRLSIKTSVDLAADRDDAALVATRSDDIEISLVSSEGTPTKARGRLGYYLTDGGRRGPFAFGALPGDRTLPITTGIASGGLVGVLPKHQVVFVDKYLVGYRFRGESRDGGGTSTRTFDLPADGSPLRASIEVEPAGAFRVRLAKDDTPTEADQVEYWFSTPEYSTGGSRIPDSGFWASPLPLSGEYELSVRRGRRIASTGKVTLTPDEPVFDQVLRFPAGTRITGRLLDAAGRPVSGGKIRAGYQYVEPQPSMLMEAAECFTGADGEFALENINFDLPNPWWLETVPEPDGPPLMPRHRLPLKGDPKSEIELRLPAVHETSGLLLDHETGRPVAGVTVEALVWVRAVAPPADRPKWTNLRQPAVAETDNQGVFIFRNLPEGPYELRLSSGEIITRRDQIKAPQSANDNRAWIDLLQVPETAAGPNVFWCRGVTK